MERLNDFLRKEFKNMLINKFDVLADRLINMRRLADMPKVGEKSGSFSSYDRQSYYDEKTEKYMNWAANNDGSGIIRKENEESVVVELNGPGVIWRVWSAKPEEGNINFYFDGENTPSYSRPFKKFFEQLTDDISPAGFPSLAPKLSGGYNSFFPVPFEKSIKVTFSEGWGEYYHFTYSLYPEEILPSFEELTSKDGLKVMAEIDRTLYNRGDQFSPDCQTKEIILTQGKQIVFDTETSGALTYLGIQLEQEKYSEEEMSRLLREVLITIYWDQQETPSVCAPLGDFFGSAPGYNLFRTLPLGMTDKRLYANWYMPYSNGAKIEFVYNGSNAITMLFNYKIEDLQEEQADEYLRFHAKWHNGDFQHLDRQDFEEGQRWPDWPLLLTRGAGRFCGTHMHIRNEWTKPDDSSKTWWYGHWDEKTIDWWWGEGDEKFFVDNERFPSTFGTGSEDYIGYAWAAEPPFALFDSAFAAQSLMPIDGNGHTSVIRLQVCDNVPFSEGFEAFIEKYKPDDWGNNNHCIYEVTPFWYQERNTTDSYRIPQTEDCIKNIK